MQQSLTVIENKKVLLVTVLGGMVFNHVYNRFGPAFIGPLTPARLRLDCPASTEPVACAACQTDIFDTPSSMLWLVHVLFLWCVAVLVCLLLMVVCTCVVLRDMRAVVCNSVAKISTQS